MKVVQYKSVYDDLASKCVARRVVSIGGGGGQIPPGLSVDGQASRRTQ